MKSLWRALSYLKSYGLTAAGAFVSLLVSSGASLLIPRMTQIIIDDGISAGQIDIVIASALGMVGLAVAVSVFTFLQGVLSARTAHGVAYDLRNQIYGKIQSLSFSYHDQAQTGQLLTRATSDVERLQQFVGMGFIQLLSAVLMMIGAITFLFVTDWQLALIILFVVPLTFGLFGFFASRARPLFTRIQQTVGQLTTILQENLAGVRVVKAFARESYEASRFERANENVLELSLAVGKLFAVGIPAIFVIADLATLAVYWFGGYQTIAGRLSVGRIVAFSNYMMMAFFPMLMLGMIIAVLSQAGASADRVFEILDSRVEILDRPDAIELKAVLGHIAFKHVSFRYFEGSDDVLHDVSFVARPGETIALLGATGSGKSTIVALVPRFYDATGGRVMIDGHDVRDVTQDSLRRRIGIVLQETTLFSGTIRDNIAFGRQDATIEEITAAAKAAEAHDFITAFPAGYDTVVGERGMTLSGGQKQRIAIARALILDPRILILDDATSAVDYETELRIQQALSRLMKGRTSLVIAQRIATVLNADQILVLHEGEIVAQGKHEDLLQTSPAYVEIYCSQLHSGDAPSSSPYADRCTASAEEVLY
ncbi:MAG: ABC transporter ATP-binding protein [Chloroflexi bacterium]|nr:ABC transporter ATP-binding protein [Chloroflexota bacterium]